MFEGADVSGVRTQKWKFLASAYYKRGEIRFDDGRQFNDPGLLFPMDIADGRERYSLAWENPKVTERLYGLIVKGRKEMTEPFKDARNAPK
jgi:hypothetical protein